MRKRKRFPAQKGDRAVTHGREREGVKKRLAICNEDGVTGMG